MDLKGLNEQQKEVVLSTDGPMMVLAGAGSGKTRALTHKVAYLVKEKNIAPWRILAITFTNKAANEMRERIAHLTNEEISKFNIFTFHSFCARVLRNEIELIGRNKNFSIYDDSESVAVIKNIIKLKKLDKDDYPYSNIHHYIKRLKDFGHYIGQKEEDISKEIEIDHEFYDLFLAYEEELKNSNAVDFGGLITDVVRILEENPEVLKKYQEKYKYVLVDEFQDTNKSQLMLTQLLVKERKNITVIGDDFQSIYRFRNADIKNFLEFDIHFPEVKFIKLEENYRSTKTIVKAANAIIENNQFQKEKNLFSNNEDGAKIKVISCFNQQVEAEFVGQGVQSLLRAGVNPNEICILFRNNAQSRTIEEILRNLRIPYILTGGMNFFERKEIKDIISLMRLIINPSDSFSFLRMINNPSRGIGSKTIDNLKDYSFKNNVSLLELIDDLPKSIKVSSKAKEGFQLFSKCIKEAKEHYEKTNKLSELYKSLIANSGYMEFLQSSVKYEDKARIDNLREFYGSLIEADIKKTSLPDYLENISLTINQDDKVNKEDCVQLMTVHSSKGLEFENVFILGLEENLFPSKQSQEENDEIYGIEEERRLFYVAVTRCKKNLSITVCKNRFLYGQKITNPASRFLKEIPEDLITIIRR